MSSDDVFMLELTVDPYENEFLFEYLQSKYREAKANYKNSRMNSDCLERYKEALKEFKEYLEGKKQHIKSKFKVASLGRLPSTEVPTSRRESVVHHEEIHNPGSSAVGEKRKCPNDTADYIYIHLSSPPAKRIRKYKSPCKSSGKDSELDDG
ncbi:unnamed protein product [Rodentolepis nana]|uniref:Protein FAR1-RELATED SEQUENCE n=1 Tax=Rodentolepis nana TaxID=102285 RepID=A0A0R3TB22_RODNA|nr:unnamed protein product [Rodentolepis nana]